MNDTGSTRLLSIGEFAAAAQLSPKALRLYDEQRLLAPAKVDAATGYRYYRADQVATGRLIRTLREMNLPLDEIARVVTATANAEWLLVEFGREQDSRHAREKQAMQKALKLLRNTGAVGTPEILNRTRAAMTVAVHPFISNRAQLFERVQADVAGFHEKLRHLEVAFGTRAYCNLVDPISDDDGRLELLVPLAAVVTTQSVTIRPIAIRQVVPASCAVLQNAKGNQGIDFTAAQDALFDWFDRNGCRASETPWLTFSTDPLEYCEMIWAYE